MRGAFFNTMVPISAQPHWALETWAFLNDRAGRPLDWALCRQGPMPDVMAPRSPDVTQLDFFMLVYVKDADHVLPLPKSIEELKDRIPAAIETISAELLDRVHYSCLG